MTHSASDIAFTPAVKRVQERKGSRKGYAKMEEKGGWRDTITEDLARFIDRRDSFYLAFADFKGNRQYISTGNLAENDKAYIFLMDYPNRRRIKIWGRARVIDDDAEILARLADPDYEGVPEQAVVFEVVAWDVNCPQHISPRFTEQEVAEIVAPLKRRIIDLEARLRTAK